MRERKYSEPYQPQRAHTHTHTAALLTPCASLHKGQATMTNPAPEYAQGISPPIYAAQARQLLEPSVCALLFSFWGPPNDRDQTDLKWGGVAQRLCGMLMVGGGVCVHQAPNKEAMKINESTCRPLKSTFRCKISSRRFPLTSTRRWGRSTGERGYRSVGGWRQLQRFESPAFADCLLAAPRRRWRLQQR